MVIIFPNTIIVIIIIIIIIISNSSSSILNINTIIVIIVNIVMPQWFDLVPGHLTYFWYFKEERLFEKGCLLGIGPSFFSIFVSFVSRNGKM